MYRKHLRRCATFSDLLPQHSSHLERFRLAKRAGLDGIEVENADSREEVQEIAEAARQTGLVIHSVKTVANYYHPLSSGDPLEVERGVQATLGALDNARLWGADSLLVIPGVVNRDVSYCAAFERATRVIRERILPVAEQYQITLAVENVWSTFLVAPNDFIRFVDQFESPRIRVCLDVGNLFYGQAEHWVSALGHRIIKLHAKDFRVSQRHSSFAWAKVGEGDVHWSAVNQALGAINFTGWVTNTGPQSFPIRAQRFAANRMQRVIGKRATQIAFGPVERLLSFRDLTDRVSRQERYL